MTGPKVRVLLHFVKARRELWRLYLRRAAVDRVLRYLLAEELLRCRLYLGCEWRDT